MRDDWLSLAWKVLVARASSESPSASSHQQRNLEQAAPLVAER